MTRRGFLSVLAIAPTVVMAPADTFAGPIRRRVDFDYTERFAAALDYQCVMYGYVKILSDKIGGAVSVRPPFRFVSDHNAR